MPIPRPALVLLAVPAVAASVLAVAPPASADVTDPFTVGYVWSGYDSSDVTYDAPSSYSYNSRGLVNRITHGGVGSYKVVFPGLGQAGGDVQVGAYGSTLGTTCKTVQWTQAGTEEDVVVRCWSPTGAAADSPFVVSFAGGGGSANTYAFTRATQPSVTSAYLAPAAYSYNSRGGRATISRSSTGTYSVALPVSGALDAGIARVTAVGNGPATCQVLDQPVRASGTVTITVGCANPAGTRVDSQFALEYASGQDLLGDNLMAVGYARANRISTSTYTPAVQKDWTVADRGTVTITRYSTGNYDVLFPLQAEQGLDGGHVQAQAYGSTDKRCQVEGWEDTSDGVRHAYVRCSGRDGTPADALFSVQYVGKLQ